MKPAENKAAGKGSRPRKVDGDKYRKNYDKIFKKKRNTYLSMSGYVISKEEFNQLLKSLNL